MRAPDPTRPRLTIRDLAREVRLDLTSRPGRTALTALGTLIGIAVLVSTLGLAASLAAQIGARFDALSATEVVVSGVQSSDVLARPIPEDAVRRAERLHGVVAASLLSEVTGAKVVGTPINDPTNPADTTTALFASSADLATEVGASLTGRFFDDWHDQHQAAVGVLGYAAAERLGIHDVARHPVILVNDQPIVVIGIITSVERRSQLLQAAIVPHGYATRHLGLRAPTQLLVSAKPGTAPTVADQLAVAVRADHPEMLSVEVPPSPDLTRRLISGDTQTLLIVLGIISLVIGGVGIANMTLVSVLERVPEIGLRRAIGASRGHIVVQFLCGTTLTGLLGGLVGTIVGVGVTFAVAAAQGWPGVMPAAVPLLSPLVGAVIGLLAGSYPARRASRIEPVDALRG